MKPCDYIAMTTRYCLDIENKKMVSIASVKNNDILYPAFYSNRASGDSVSDILGDRHNLSLNFYGFEVRYLNPSPNTVEFRAEYPVESKKVSVSYHEDISLVNSLDYTVNGTAKKWTKIHTKVFNGSGEVINGNICLPLYKRVPESALEPYGMTHIPASVVYRSKCLSRKYFVFYSGSAGFLFDSDFRVCAFVLLKKIESLEDDVTIFLEELVHASDTYLMKERLLLKEDEYSG